MANSHVLDMPAVIIDNGSGLSKAGLSGDIVPRSVIDSVIGYPKLNVPLAKMVKIKQKMFLVGEEAQKQCNSLSLEYPIERGVVKNWDNMEKLWDHLFKRELEVKPNEQPVLLMEHALNPKKIREKTAEFMFEKYEVPAMCLFNHAAGALYASASVTGLVVESGDGVTCTVPIYEGHPLPHAVTKLFVAGKDITTRLIQLLFLKRYMFSSIFNKAFIDEMKETMCFVAMEPEEDNGQQEVQRDYTLPDGHVIQLDGHLCRLPEAVFTPNLLGIQEPGITKMACSSIEKCDVDIQNHLFANIVLSGGNTLFPGLGERLMKELKSATSPQRAIRITASPDRSFSTWIGASVITCLSTFKQRWVTASEFKEFGKSVIQRKCF
ncbi:actin-related protein T1-like [Perognathus longimembris pacificus]|uniref:actin-related protein T1-like n=1 Tax=Perognathus longimembris pacificus TaxID=214514 RepID=UPI002018BF21|nr:actin-related protein T1-like [Perognathus longimembris pacificus]